MDSPCSCTSTSLPQLWQHSLVIAPGVGWLYYTHLAFLDLWAAFILHHHVRWVVSILLLGRLAAQLVVVVKLPFGELKFLIASLIFV